MKPAAYRRTARLPRTSALFLLLLLILCVPARAAALLPAVRLSAQTVFHAQVRGGVSYAPLHALARALGASVQYADARRTAVLHAASCTLYLSAGTTSVRVDGRTVSLPAAPYREAGTLMVPLRAVAALLDMDAYYDSDAMTVTLTPGAAYDPADIPEGLRIPVLMYHAVAEETWGLSDLFVRPADMEAQLRWLSENGYTTVTFEDLPHLRAGMRPVMLTFDDGYMDNYTNLFPLLKKHNAKATIFVVTGSIGNGRMLTESQLREMADSGLVSIQSHTVSHPSLPSLSDAALLRELTASQLSLTRITGRRPFVLSYPNGEHDAHVVRAAKGLYTFGIKKDGGIYTTGDDPFYVNRRRVSRRTGLDGFPALLR